MKYSIFSARKFLSATRITLLASCALALAACETDRHRPDSGRRAQGGICVGQAGRRSAQHPGGQAA